MGKINKSLENIINLNSTYNTAEDTFKTQLSGFLDRLKNKLNSLTIKTETFSNNGTTIELKDNTVYIYNGNGGVSNLNITYPKEGNFMSTILFSTATSGTINITFPSNSKFAGSTPYEFFPGENWELNIYNGIVVGSPIYSDNN